MRPKVSVIIPCRNEAASIGACIDSIAASDYGKENLEILVVDGMSDDDSRHAIAEKQSQYPFVKLIDNPARITPLAFNLGIAHATGDYILIAGARHILAPNYISTCIAILESDPNIACAGGRVENEYANRRAQIIAKGMDSPFGVGGGNFRVLTEDAFVDTVGTPVYRKGIFSEVGLFDEQLVRNQDDEFNFRLLKRGYKIRLTVRTSVRYFVRAAFSKLYRQYFQYGYWKVYVNRKHRTVTTLRQLFPALFIAFVIAGLPMSFVHEYILFAYAGVLALYLAAALFFAAAKSMRPGILAQVMYTFLVLHFAYGIGYLKGAWDFLILRKKYASATAARLSR